MKLYIIFNKITNKSKNFESFISCPLGQSFREEFLLEFSSNKKGIIR